jgi:uncharacterized coiled-coil protein SlyX
MPGTLEERVAYLEGKVEEQSRLGSELREMIFHLDQKIDRFREELSARIDALDQKLNTRIDATNARIDALDHKLSRYFHWIIGIQVTIFLAIIATFLR